MIARDDLESGESSSGNGFTRDGDRYDVGVGVGGMALLDPAFDEQLQIRRTRLILLKTMLKRKIQMTDLKPLAAAVIVAIEKRAVTVVVRHSRADDGADISHRQDFSAEIKKLNPQADPDLTQMIFGPCSHAFEKKTVPNDNIVFENY